MHRPRAARLGLSRPGSPSYQRLQRRVARAAGHRGRCSHRFFGETAATGGAMSGTGPGRRAGETDSRSPEPVETNYAISGRVYGPQRR